MDVAAAEMPLEDQIETQPTEDEFYRPVTGSIDVVYRWSRKHGWQKSAGWYPDDVLPRLRLRRLVPGPQLIPTRDEPSKPGATVVEHGTDYVYVRTADGRWVGGGGVKSWSEITYPTLKGTGYTV